MHLPEHITTLHERGWQWFAERAHGRHAVAWLVVLAFLEPIISPIVPETLMVAMLLAPSEEKRWKHYAALITAASFLGGMVGYVVGVLVFRAFGEGVLGYFGLHDIHDTVTMILAGNIFLVMAFVTFTPLPDKFFTILSGFVGAPFLPFAAGFLLGRSIRFILVAYLVHRFGARVLDSINRYLGYTAVALVVLAIIYGMVHWHLVPWLG